jgi:hypothetical protein
MQNLSKGICGNTGVANGNQGGHEFLLPSYGNTASNCTNKRITKTA